MLESYKLISESNNWLGIMPEIMLGVGAVLLLVLELFVPKDQVKQLPRLAILIQLGVLVGLLAKWNMASGEVHNFAGMIAHSSLGQIMRVFFLISSIMVSLMSLNYLKRENLPRVEFFNILMITTAGAMLLVQSTHFLMLFIALETMTVGLFVLVSYAHKNAFSLEAGLKFLILAALSSSMLLFGIVLLYGMGTHPELAGTSADALNFSALAEFINVNADNLIVKIGVVLVICGLAFKIGAFPFQIWIPDVYQGAPTPVTAFLSVSSKAAGLIVLINLLKGPFAGMQEAIVPLLTAIAIVTILFGNITAVPQSNVKRLMGLSGIAHAGYLLIGVIAMYSVPWALGAILFYLFTYMLGSYGVFFVMNHARGQEDSQQDLEDYESFAKKNPFLGTSLVVGLGSLAGIPPLAGFIGKLLLFVAAFQAELYLLLGVAIVGVVISIYYYFGWIRDAFFVLWGTEASDNVLEGAIAKKIEINWVTRVVVSAIMLATLVLGIYQGLVGELVFF
jgi:NADH-quinone oxidoreductase subunit N